MAATISRRSVRGGPFEDLSCVFQAGEHPWIVQPSYAAYDYARIHPDDYLDRLARSGAIRMEAAFPGHLLDRIRQSAQNSPNLPGDFLQLLIDQGLV